MTDHHPGTHLQVTYSSRISHFPNITFTNLGLLVTLFGLHLIFDKLVFYTVFV